MIRLKHLSGSLQGRTAELAKPVLRIGRAPDCDVRFDQVKDPKVSNHHAELLLEEGNWFVVDTASTNGTLINGRRIAKHRLASGDKLQIGSGGPVLQIHFDGILIEEPSFKTEAILLQDISQPPRAIDDSEEISAISDHLKASADTQTARLAELAAKKVAMERAKTGGQSSGKTMFIMAETMRQVQFSTKAKTKKRWVKVVAAVAGAAAVVVGVMSVVIVQQQRQIAKLVQTKNKLDKEIQQVQAAMDSESDTEKLEQLEQRLAQLTGNAQKAIDDLGKADKSKAAEVANAGDQMDRDIRKILAKFDAKTYAVPPVFKERCGSSAPTPRAATTCGWTPRWTSGSTRPRRRAPPPAIWPTSSPSSARIPSCWPWPATTAANPAYAASSTRSPASPAGSRRSAATSGTCTA